MRFPDTMFTIQNSFRPLLLNRGGGGGGGNPLVKVTKNIARRKTLKAFIPIRSKNSASLRYLL